MLVFRIAPFVHRDNRLVQRPIVHPSRGKRSQQISICLPKVTVVSALIMLANCTQRIYFDHEDYESNIEKVHFEIIVVKKNKKWSEPLLT